MSLSLMRVTAHDFATCNGSSVVPELRLYDLRKKATSLQARPAFSEKVVPFDLEPFFEEDYYTSSTAEYLFHFLQNRTGYVAPDCAKLSQVGLPPWTPCETQAKDRGVPPIVVNGVFHVETRAQFEYLMWHYNRVFVHFRDDTKSADIGPELSKAYVEAGMRDNTDDWKEALDAAAVGNDIFRRLFEDMAIKYHDDIQRGIAVFATTPSTPALTMLELGALFHNGSIKRAESWYAVDKCSLNFGMTYGGPCAIGDYDGVNPQVGRAIWDLPCWGDGGSLGTEWDCTEAEMEEWSEFEQEFEKRIARTRMEVQPTHDGGRVNSKELQSLLQRRDDDSPQSLNHTSPDAVFVRYGMENGRDFGFSTRRTNEGWDIAAKYVYSQSRNNTNSNFPSIDMVRVECDLPAAKDACQNLYAFPTFHLYLANRPEPFNFQFRDTERNESTFSQRLANALTTFLQEQLGF